MKKLLLFPFIAALCLYSFHLQAQHKPYPVYDVQPKIVQKPYLIDPSEEGMTVVWLTDSMSQSQVVYWEKEKQDYKKVAENQKHGLVAVDTRHTIRLNHLKAGTIYNYKVRSRRVVEIRPYWPIMGQWIESPVYSFKTFDRDQSKVTFSSISDTHGNVKRTKKLMRKVDWDHTDFFVQTGDALDWIQSETQIYNDWLHPIAEELNQRIPFLYVRGNHDLRGPMARQWFSYFPYHEGRFYFARDEGPAHFIILDSGEDKADSTNVYAGLNRLKEYRAEEYQWFAHHVKTNKRYRKAPFRIVLIHDPGWGWMDGKNDRWTKLANKADIDLVIAGHWHRFKRINPGSKRGNEYPILVVGQEEIAHVEVTDKKITVKVENIEGQTVDAFQINRKGHIEDL